MKLALASEVMDDLGFGTGMTDALEAVEAALNAAEPVLAGKLGTQFDYATVTDTYYLVEAAHIIGSSYQTTFKLSRGFVDNLNSFVRAGSPSALTSDFVDLLEYGVLNGDKGLVLDMTTAYNRQYVQINYTSGFEVDGADDTSYTLWQVPDWLQEAAKIQAKILLVDHPTIADSGLKLDQKMMERTLAEALRPHLRYAPTAVLPI
jgi:hypothetical protein